MQDQVQEIKEKTNIVDIIGEHVTLKKGGRHHKGLCPFHSEKSPSFMVSEELQIFKCFGCGESGDVISFLEKYEGMEFYEALKHLASRARIEIKPVAGYERSDREALIEANTLAAKFYNYLLLHHKLGETGKEYLLKQRRLTLKTIKTFLLGVAPSSPTALHDFLAKKGVSDAMMEKSGLIYKTERGRIDRFRGRIIFPIFDHRGNIIALAGRILPQNDNKNVGKYINSPETPIYHKSSSLYGLFQTKGEIKRAKHAVLVEGELDLLSSWQADVENIVAIKGSALTEGQLKILSRFADQVTLALDSDFAGDNAALKGIFQAQNLGLEVSVARLGDYKDPDDFAREDEAGYKKAIQDAVGLWDFIVDLYFTRNDPQKGEGKSRISKSLIPLLSEIEDTIVQAHYAKLVAQRLDVPFEAVMSEIARFTDKTQALPEIEKNKALDEESQKLPKNRRELLEEQLASLYLQVSPAELIRQENRHFFQSPRLHRIIDELEKYMVKEKDFKPQLFYEKLPKELVDGAANLYLYESGTEEENLREIQNIIKELNALAIRSEIQQIIREISAYELAGQEDNLQLAQQKFSKLTKKLADLETSKS